MVRFPKGKWLRLMDQLMQAADEANPGDPDGLPWSHQVTLTPAQFARQEARSADFDDIWTKAQALHDSLSTLRR